MCLDMLCMQAVGNIKETNVCVSQHMYVHIHTPTQVCVFVCVYPNSNSQLSQSLFITTS